MTAPASGSLQHKLVKTTLWSGMIAGCSAFVLLVFISFYHSMSVQDEIMDEVADMLLLSDVDLPSGQQLDELSDEFDVQYALYWNNEVLTHSKKYQVALFQQTFKNDFGFIWQNGRVWRTYFQEKPDARLKAIIIQPLNERFVELWQSLGWYALALMVLWLFQWGLVRRGIRHDLASLRQLSTSIAAKSPQDLQPISQKHSISEIQPVIDALNLLLERLSRALHAEQRFTADASHELRSPLSAIQMRLQLLKRRYENLPEFRQELGHIQTDVVRSTQILENLLLLARLDPAHANELPKTMLRLDEVVVEVIEALNLFAQSKKVTVVPQLNTVNTHIWANQELIFTSIRNIMDNAIRYASSQSEVKVLLEEVCPETKTPMFKLTIINKGDVLEEDTVQKLGQRFFRALGSGQKGSGLGLSITNKIMDLHQGELQFERLETGGLKVQLLFRSYTGQNI